jgi:hypothetical protein
VLVPSNLEDLAEQYFKKSDMTPNTVREKNTFEGTKYIVDPNLDDYDENKIYYFSDRHKAIQMAYLMGNRNPFVAREIDFDTDNLKVKVRHEFGTQPLDHRFIQCHEHDPLAEEDGFKTKIVNTVRTNVINEMLEVHHNDSAPVPNPSGLIDSGIPLDSNLASRSVDLDKEFDEVTSESVSRNHEALENLKKKKKPKKTETIATDSDISGPVTEPK